MKNLFRRNKVVSRKIPVSPLSRQMSVELTISVKPQKPNGYIAYMGPSPDNSVCGETRNNPWDAIHSFVDEFEKLVND